MFEKMRRLIRSDSWARYAERTENDPVRRLTKDAMQYVAEKGEALELGPGAMNEVSFLLDQGFNHVVAVNAEPLEAVPVARERAAHFPNDRFAYVQSAFDAFDFKPDTYHFINAQRSLSFNNPQTFDRMFASLLASLKPGGILAGNFFGVEHSWSSDRSKAFLTRERAEKLLKDCEILHFEELKPKDVTHNHEIEFIVRKK